MNKLELVNITKFMLPEHEDSNSDGSYDGQEVFINPSGIKKIKVYRRIFNQENGEPISRIDIFTGPENMSQSTRVNMSKKKFFELFNVEISVDTEDKDA